MSIAEKAEVVVIGGGVIGCSCAYYLAKEGVDVALVEINELASGATGANQGGVPRLPLELPSSELDLYRESEKLYHILAREFEDYEIEYEEFPLMLVADQEDQVPVLEKFAKSRKNLGIDCNLLYGKEIKKIEPNLAENIPAISLSFEDGAVNPFRLTLAFAYSAKKLGAKIYEFNEVKKIKLKRGRINSVITNEKEIKTNFIVNAAGVWAPFIGKMIDLDIPIYPQKGQILVTESMPKLINASITDADYLMAWSSPWDLAKSKNPRIKAGIATTLRQTKSGNILIGSSREFARYDQQVDPYVLRLISQRATRFMPIVKSFNIIRTYAGLRPYSKDGLPIISKVKKIGHNGEGITLGPITGKLVSELITKDETSISIDKFSFSRFGRRANN